MMLVNGEVVFDDWFVYADGFTHLAFMLGTDDEVMRQDRPCERTICNKIVPYSAMREDRSYNQRCPNCLCLSIMIELAE